MKAGREDSMHELAGTQHAVVFPARVASLGRRHVVLDAPLPCAVKVSVAKITFLLCHLLCTEGTLVRYTA